MHKNTGFSLIEVLICSIIIGIVGITLAKIQGVFTLNNGLAAQKIEASNIAQSRLDQLRQFIDTHNQLISTETIDNGTAIDLVGDVSTTGKSASFINKICIKRTTAETSCRTSASELTFAEQDQLLIQSTTSWTDASNTPQNVVLFTKVQKSTAPWPNPICQWTATNTAGYQKGMFALHTESSNKKNVWLCNKSIGCGVASPSSAGSGWVDVGQFSNTGTIINTSACTPPNADGSPKVASATATPTATSSATPLPSATPGALKEWKAGETYQAGQEIIFEGQRYVCIQGHPSLPGWTPAAVPALWKKL